jgi:hypothetical protein
LVLIIVLIMALTVALTVVLTLMHQVTDWNRALVASGGWFRTSYLELALTSPARKREMPLGEMSQLYRHLTLPHTLLEI